MTPRRHFNRIAILAWALWVGLVGDPSLGEPAPHHRSILNRQLLGALLQNDKQKALTLINKGADPNT